MLVDFIAMNTFLIFLGLCLVGVVLCALIFFQAQQIASLKEEVFCSQRQVREQIEASGALRKNAKTGWDESRAWFARYATAQKELEALAANAASSSHRWAEEAAAWNRWAVIEGGMHLEGESSRVQRLLLSRDLQQLRSALAELQRKERAAV
jgi:biopolymer transport protein ExbB/TolQ